MLRGQKKILTYRKVVTFSLGCDRMIGQYLKRKHTMAYRKERAWSTASKSNWLWEAGACLVAKRGDPDEECLILAATSRDKQRTAWRIPLCETASVISEQTVRCPKPSGWWNDNRSGRFPGPRQSYGYFINKQRPTKDTLFTTCLPYRFYLRHQIDGD